MTLGTVPPPTMSRPGTMRCGTTAIHTPRSVTHTAHFDVLAQFAHTTPRSVLSPAFYSYSSALWFRKTLKLSRSAEVFHVLTSFSPKWKFQLLKGQIKPLKCSCVPSDKLWYLISRLLVLICFGLFPQLVWATSSRIGCAINVCYNMNVWGMIWAKAVYLVCNYSPPYVSFISLSTSQTRWSHSQHVHESTFISFEGGQGRFFKVLKTRQYINKFVIAHLAFSLIASKKKK